MNIDTICVLGGGSAGWMAAATFIKLFPNKKITLIESPAIGTIGVGESTTQFIREWLKLLEIQDNDWMDDCDATYKMSVRFENFNEDVPFHYPFTRQNVDSSLNPVHASTWFIHRTLTQAPVDTFAKYFSTQYKCLEENRIPTENFRGFDMQIDTGFHMDAVKFANWLKEKYCLPKGVNHEYADIVNYEKNEDGYLTCIQSNDGTKYYADLFVDCTGFKSYLISEVMGTGWENFNDILLNDSAWAVRLPYTNKKQQLKNYTNCTALSSGWVWNVPLRNRIGTGYNYSSKFLSDEESLNEFKEHLGNPETLCDYRNIKFKTGLSEKIWNKNVLAIGLSAGFIEPLESNGLLSVHNFLIWACEIISSRNKINTMDINSFNMKAKSFFKVFAYFVAYHYGMSTRSDSPYWNYITKNYDWLSKLNEEEIYSLGEKSSPIDKLLPDKWTYYNFGGALFIAAGHDYNPFSSVTLKLLHNRGQIDLESFKKIEYPEDTYKIQETFPIASDYYEN